METTLSNPVDSGFYICPQCNASFAEDTPELKRDLDVVVCEKGHVVVSLADVRKLPRRTFWNVTIMTNLVVWLTFLSLIFSIGSGVSMEPHPNHLTLLLALGGFAVAVVVSISNFVEGNRCRAKGGPTGKLAASYTNAGYAVLLGVPLGVILAVQPILAIIVYLGYGSWVYSQRPTTQS